jgi:hypothetical protein
MSKNFQDNNNHLFQPAEVPYSYVVISISLFPKEKSQQHVLTWKVWFLETLSTNTVCVYKF